MGIYPFESKERQGDTLLLKSSTPGVERIEVFQRVAVIENRDDCYCCSCNPEGYSQYNDPFCRNHGFYGKRPCDIHDMPGSPSDDFPPVMPDPVSVKRARDKERQA